MQMGIGYEKVFGNQMRLVLQRALPLIRPADTFSLGEKEARRRFLQVTYALGCFCAFGNHIYGFSGFELFEAMHGEFHGEPADERREDDEPTNRGGHPGYVAVKSAATNDQERK